jgi:hypothetical protein
MKMIGLCSVLLKYAALSHRNHCRVPMGHGKSWVMEKSWKEIGYGKSHGKLNAK